MYRSREASQKAVDHAHLATAVLTENLKCLASMQGTIGYLSGTLALTSSRKINHQMHTQGQNEKLTGPSLLPCAVRSSRLVRLTLSPALCDHQYEGRLLRTEARRRERQCPRRCLGLPLRIRSLQDYGSPSESEHMMNHSSNSHNTHSIPSSHRRHLGSRNLSSSGLIDLHRPQYRTLQPDRKRRWLAAGCRYHRTSIEQCRRMESMMSHCHAYRVFEA